MKKIVVNRFVCKMNKKADVSIVLLVFLTLFLCGAALFVFATSNERLENVFINPQVLDKLYFDEEQTIFSVQEAGHRALIKTYYDFIKENKYVKNPITKNIDGFDYVEFNGVWPDIDNRFKLEFEKNFFSELEKYNLEELGLKKEEFNINVMNKVINIRAEKIGKTLGEEKISVIHYYNINVEINLANEGLSSFNDIYNAKNKPECNLKDISINDKEDCIEKELSNFKVNIEGRKSSVNNNENSKEVLFYNLVSKKQFWFEKSGSNVMENIQIIFVD